MDPEIIRRIARLEEIVGRDPGRGITPLVEATRGDLASSAASLAVHPAPHVAILTGFFIPYADPPVSENDGPIGAAHLAAAFARAGAAVRLVTDSGCAEAVKAAARAAGADGSAFDVIESEDDIAAVLADWNAEPTVSHVIAIERVGPSADGTYRNMKGNDISAHTAPLDLLFQPGRVRIGIGDGGNELGMGKLPRELVVSAIPRGELIGCVVGCEHLLVCGVSNWGALALQAALALARPSWRDAMTAGLTVERDREVLAALAVEGVAVDGMLGRPSMSVDRLPWEEHAEIVGRLREVLVR